MRSRLHVASRAPFLVGVVCLVSAAAVAQPLGAAPASVALYASTAEVEALALHDGTLWAGTRGGLEAWDAASGVRRRLYTAADGLAESWVVAVRAGVEGVEVRTPAATCRLDASSDRFQCAPAPRVASQPPHAAELVSVGAATSGERVTARVAGFVGTATSGVWHDDLRTRLTAGAQPCVGHVTAIARWKEATWLGTFNGGLCRKDARGFTKPTTPFRMVNALKATRDGLYVGAAEGLFRTRDGRRWQHIALRGASEASVVGLAADGTTLWATQPGTLVQLPLTGRTRRAQVLWMPGNAHSLQRVDVRDGRVWVATEDSGVLSLPSAGRLTRKTPVEVHDRAAGLPTSWALDAVATAYGVALATLRHGLVLVDMQGASRTVPELEGAWLLHVFAEDEAGRVLWVGAQPGVWRVEDGHAQRLDLPLPHPNVHAVARFGDELWVGTENGLVVATLPAPEALASRDAR